MKTLTILFRCFVLGTLVYVLPACSINPADADADADAKSKDNIESATYVSGEANIALVQRFIDAQMKGDGQTMRKLATADFIARNPAGDSLSIDEYADKWTYLNQIRANQDAGVFATNSQQVDSGPLKGSWVLFWGTYTAIDMIKQKPMEVLWHADFLLIDGKISRSVSYFDMVDPEDSV